MFCELCAGQPAEYKCNTCTSCKIFKGNKTQSEFCEWLFQSPQTDNSVAIAHNAKGYDSYFLLEFFFENACIPSVIYSGAKVMCIDVPQYKRRIIDSMSFLPMALSKLSATFGLTELRKGFFPHFFNTQHNQKYVGPIPNARYYDSDSMSERRRKEFYVWYEAQKRENRVFDLQEELLAYCISDVDILKRCCIQFRELFMQITGDCARLIHSKHASQ